MQTHVIDDVTKRIADQCDDGLMKVNLQVQFSPVFDAARIAVRTIVTRIPEKVAPFPSFSELYYRGCTSLLQDKFGITVTEPDGARIKVTIISMVFRSDEG